MHLTGFPEWRLRVGDWRVRFQFDYAGHQIVVLRVADARTVIRMELGASQIRGGRAGG